MLRHFFARSAIEAIKFFSLFFFLFNITEALKLYGSRLTAYERLEIEHYPEIWYLGLESRKIHGEEGAPQNGGYDDENGSYHKVCIAFFFFFFLLYKEKLI